MSGERPVDWIYIDDVAVGLVLLAFGGPIDGTYVDLGSGRLITTGDVARRICTISNTGTSPRFGALPDRVMEQVRTANIAETEAMLGWTPSTGIDAGLAQTYEWYKELALAQDP